MQYCKISYITFIFKQRQFIYCLSCIFAGVFFILSFFVSNFQYLCFAGRISYNKLSAPKSIFYKIFNELLSLLYTKLFQRYIIQYNAVVYVVTIPVGYPAYAKPFHAEVTVLCAFPHQIHKVSFSLVQHCHFAACQLYGNAVFYSSDKVQQAVYKAAVCRYLLQKVCVAVGSPFQYLLGDFQYHFLVNLCPVYISVFVQHAGIPHAVRVGVAVPHLRRKLGQFPVGAQQPADTAGIPVPPPCVAVFQPVADFVHRHTHYRCIGSHVDIYSVAADISFRCSPVSVGKIFHFQALAGRKLLHRLHSLSCLVCLFGLLHCRLLYSFPGCLLYFGQVLPVGYTAFGQPAHSIYFPVFCGGHLGHLSPTFAVFAHNGICKRIHITLRRYAILRQPLYCRNILCRSPPCLLIYPGLCLYANLCIRPALCLFCCLCLCPDVCFSADIYTCKRSTAAQNCTADSTAQCTQHKLLGTERRVRVLFSYIHKISGNIAQCLFAGLRTALYQQFFQH